MASSDSSSSAVLGRITWQTSMAMNNDGTTPAISDEFRTNRWTTPQENQGMIKYTQYVETGRDSGYEADTSSTTATAVAAVSMKVNGVEKVDFGWLQKPKFVCFTNSTPEGAAPATIFVGVDSEEAAIKVVDGEADASSLFVPPWFISQEAVKYGSESWPLYSSTYHIPGDTSQSTVEGWGNNNFCQEVFEIPPGVTIGPIIVPDDVTYWVYKNAKTDSTQINSSDSAYPGAILITEAYDA